MLFTKKRSQESQEDGHTIPRSHKDSSPREVAAFSFWEYQKIVAIMYNEMPKAVTAHHFHRRQLAEIPLTRRGKNRARTSIRSPSPLSQPPITLSVGSRDTCITTRPTFYVLSRSKIFKSAPLLVHLKPRKTFLSYLNKLVL